MLRLNPQAIVRPMAEGCLVWLGDAPLILGSVEERILAMCQVPTELAELIEALTDLDVATPARAAAAVEGLLEARVTIVG